MVNLRFSKVALLQCASPPLFAPFQIMPNVGRPKASVWVHFDRQRYKTAWQGTCIACNGPPVFGKEKFLWAHLAWCERVSMDTRAEAKAQVNSMKAKDEPKKSAAPPKSLKQKQFTVVSLPAVSSSEQVLLEDALMKFIASANVPFTVVENAHFRQLCSILRGNAVNMPTRKSVANVLLPRLYASLHGEMVASLVGQLVELGRFDSILGHLVIGPCMAPKFVQSSTCKLNRLGGFTKSQP